jgi:GTP-binding protein EngB required for normal cell division
MIVIGEITREIKLGLMSVSKSYDTNEKTVVSGYYFETSAGKTYVYSVTDITQEPLDTEQEINSYLNDVAVNHPIP